MSTEQLARFSNELGKNLNNYCHIATMLIRRRKLKFSFEGSWKVVLRNGAFKFQVRIRGYSV